MTPAEHQQAREQERADLYELARQTDRSHAEQTLVALGVDPAELDAIFGGTV
ncbi:hypothetical protein M8Z33_07370 [Streptomyces sp. ZAF1911]|uniref:hypothetical protein n=1 Tax=unclassified Streptomyces TaxID=2593676 RepID=UPI00237A8160|nr:hypothetical protein [Streptomyces sp. ZAF1911]MDD9376493.1 hypothetical protein [Streptomyces sp. ZAF1911]